MLFVIVAILSVAVGVALTGSHVIGAILGVVAAALICAHPKVWGH